MAKAFIFNARNIEVHGLTSQAEQVLDLILRDGRVTRLSAMHYGVANLTARITELRDRLDGHGIDVACTEKRDANGHRYGVWSLAALEPAATTAPNVAAA